MAKFGAREVARLEVVYASPAISGQRARMRAVLGARPGERGLDIGCGPAFLACELGLDVGPDGRIVGIDESPEMLEAARARIAREGLGARVEVRPGDAARLDLPAAAFDFVTAVQVYLYVPDIEGALAEAARVLRPGGRLAVLHLPPRLPALLERAGLSVVHAEGIPLLELHGGPDTFSGGLIGSTADLAARHGVSREDAEAWRTDLQARASRGDYFFSLMRFLFVARRPPG
jgi:SAM-dependent methyltransferase